MKRELIAEWWEVRWSKAGVEVRVDSGWPADAIRPAGTFGSSEAAHKATTSRYHKVVHVRRYAVRRG